MPDVSGIDAEFDYDIPESMVSRVRTGTIVRVVLNGRRIRGWVTDENATAPAGVALKPVQKVSGAGPSKELLQLARWAAWRWFGKQSFFAITASPPRVVADVLPDISFDEVPADRRSDVRVHRIGPANPTYEFVLDAVRAGPCLVLTPSHRSAGALVRRLQVDGHSPALHPDDWATAAKGGVSVVGTRTAAWARLAGIDRVLVLDVHDEAYQSERSPTWSAIDVVLERSRRRGIPVDLFSPVPRLGVHSKYVDVRVDRVAERRGWAPLHVVDLRHTDPRSGMYSPALVKAVRSDQRVAIVLNRKGRAQLLICARCDEIARCRSCAGPLSQNDDDFTCSRCHGMQPTVCFHCGATTFKQLRPGVSKVRDELESLANRPVGELNTDTDALPDTKIIIGTEAVLHRVGRADVVVFIDFDQELLATRYQAPEDALILLARASRIVGGHHRNGHVIVQTRQPGHDVIDAAVNGDPDRFYEKESERREVMQWPPFTALARVSGKQAETYLAPLRLLDSEVDVLGPVDGVYLVRAPDHPQLCDALARVSRPSGTGLRVEVDPHRV